MTNDCIELGKNSLRSFFQSLPLPLRHLKSYMPDKDEYNNWLQKYHDLDKSELTLIHDHIKTLHWQPLFSIILPVYNPDPKYLRLCIESVLEQLYPKWELCIADDASTVPTARHIISEYSATDSRIQYVFRKTNGHIAECSNSALQLASGDFIAFLDQDDTIHQTALYFNAVAIDNNPSATLLYSDEDKIDESGSRFDPYFKPDWSSDLFLSQNYLNHLSVYRSSVVKLLGGLRDAYVGAQDYDLALRVISAIGADQNQIIHIHRILYHWRAIKGSIAYGIEEKTYAHINSRKAIRAHLSANAIRATVTKADIGEFNRVQYELQVPQPLVSLVILSAGKMSLLPACIEGLLAKTNYENLEILVVAINVENQNSLDYLECIKRSEPKIQVRYCNEQFSYSRLHNKYIPYTSGRFLCLFNDDVIPINDNWLVEMVSHAQRNAVGCVGSKLSYPNGTLQHAGVILGIKGIGGHIHKGEPDNNDGYFGRANLIQNFSAVTSACLVMRREVYDELMGLDENLPGTFSDVDLCIRIVDCGYSIVWTPYAHLYHLESATLKPTEPMFSNSIAYMHNKWRKRLISDTAFNPNLSLEHNLFELAYPPRLSNPWIPLPTKMDDFVVMIDFPKNRLNERHFSIQGWIASVSEVLSVRLEQCKKNEIGLYFRPDVMRHMLNFPYTTGFRGQCAIDKSCELDRLDFAIVTKDGILRWSQDYEAAEENGSFFLGS